MDVFHSSGREVVVDNQVDTLEVNPTGHESSADQHPDLPRTETAHNIVPLMRQKRPVKENIIYYTNITPEIKIKEPKFFKNLRSHEKSSF